MTAFEPGEGWRPLRLGETTAGHEYIEHGTPDDTLGVWVREEPVAALPTDDMTVVFAHWGEESATEIIRTPSGWKYIELVDMADEDRDRITGFEVLADPTPRVALYEEQQRVARDIIALIAAQPWAREVDLQKLRDEFGVSS